MIGIARGIITYFVLSTAALAFVVYYEHQQQNDFFNMMMELQTKPVYLLVLLNFILVLADLI